MKIDIHTHTKKCKSGDAITREIDAQDLCEVHRVLLQPIEGLYGTWHRVQADIKARLTLWELQPGYRLLCRENPSS